MWVQVALFVTSLVISYLLQPKPPAPKPSAFDDVKFPVVDDGMPKIMVFGDVWITDWCVIGVGNYRTTPINKKQKGLFGSKRQTVGHRYLMSLHMGLCLAMDEIVSIKIGDRLAWGDGIKNLATIFSFKTLLSGEFSDFDTLPANAQYDSSANINRLRINQPNLFGGDDKEGGVKGILTVMKGASDQVPLPELQQMHNGAVPAYRGVVTLFFDGIVCANSPYPKAWAFRVRRTACEWYGEKSTIWLDDGNGNKIKAMNPAHIIFEAQTNEDWGRGTDIGQLDLDSFKQCADTLFDERFGMCIAWKRQDTLKQFIQQILDHIGGALMIDRTTGLWKLVLIRESNNPDSLPSFDYGSGILRIEEDNNSSNDLVTNQLVVSYTDPISNETRTVRTENLASIQRDGVILQNKSYIGLPTADLAGRVASRDMKVIQSHLKKFKIVFDRRAYALQPASAFMLKLPNRGIESIIMRAVRVEHNELTNGEISVTAVQDVFGLPRTTYSQVQPSLWVQPNLAPEPIKNIKLWQLPYTHLLDDFSPEQVAMGDNYVLVLAERPNSVQQGFEIWAKTTDEPSEQYAGQGQFVSCAMVQNAVAQTSQITTLTLDGIGVMSIGQCALLNNEIVQIQAIDFDNRQVSIKRGCMDTVPTAHAQNSAIWFYDGVAVVAERAVKAGQTLNVKLLSQTSQGTLDLSNATANSLLIDNRQVRPFAPANVQINGLSYPNQIQALNKISWVGRNKIGQNTAILDQTAPHQTPETGTTFGLIISKKVSETGDYQVVAEKHDFAGFELDIVKENPSNDDNKLVANLENAVMIKVELWAVKDGLESWQRHSIEVAVINL